MTFFKLLLLLVLIPYNLSDSIKVKSPLINQVISNNSLIVEYTIIRDDSNNRLFINRTTTNLLNYENTVLVSYKRTVINSTLVRINVNNTFNQNNQNFTIRIIASGRYRNNRTVGQFLINIPIQIKPINITDTKTEQVKPTITVNTITVNTDPVSNNGLKNYISILLILFIFTCKFYL